MQRLAPIAVRADEGVDVREEHEMRRDGRAVPQRVADLREQAHRAVRLEVVVYGERGRRGDEREMHDVAGACTGLAVDVEGARVQRGPRCRGERMRSVRHRGQPIGCKPSLFAACA